jgi:hypothetical protein
MAADRAFMLTSKMSASAASVGRAAFFPLRHPLLRLQFDSTLLRPYVDQRPLESLLDFSSLAIRQTHIHLNSEVLI